MPLSSSGATFGDDKGDDDDDGGDEGKGDGQSEILLFLRCRTTSGIIVIILNWTLFFMIGFGEGSFSLMT